MHNLASCLSLPSQCPPLCSQQHLTSVTHCVRVTGRHWLGLKRLTAYHRDLCREMITWLIVVQQGMKRSIEESENNLIHRSHLLLYSMLIFRLYVSVNGLCFKSLSQDTHIYRNTHTCKHKYSHTQRELYVGSNPSLRVISDNNGYHYDCSFLPIIN